MFKKISFIALVLFCIGFVTAQTLDNSKVVYILFNNHIEGDGTSQPGDPACPSDTTYQTLSLPPIGILNFRASYAIDLFGTQLLHERTNLVTDSFGEHPKWFQPDISAQAVSFHAGVYSLLGPNGATAPSVYANPHVAGIAVRTGWGTLEPVEGQYDWSYLDNEIQKAASAGKKVSLFIAGALFSRATPDWVYTAGAQPYYFIDQNPFHPTYGDTLKMPLPWDSVYIAKWTRFIRVLGSRYANDATISYIRGASESVTNGWGLSETDAFGRSWTAYGYTPDKLLAAWKTVLEAFMVAFPKTALWDEVGHIIFEPQVSGKSQTYVAEQIAQYGFQTYPDRFCVWREDISGCIPNPPTDGYWKILWDHKGRNGAQITWNVQDGPKRMNKCGIAPNDKPTVLKAAVQRGLDYGMPYLEIYQADVIDIALTSVIQFAAENLGKNPTSVDERDQLPTEFVLHQNYPNPFNPTTIIKYNLPEDTHVKLMIYDILGREVTTLVNEFKKLGSYEVVWNAAGLPSRVYFYRLETQNFTETKKFLLVK
ncbi:MAG: T9SS type A sorting domain-containing protein [Bacteroidota bacterium]|nr:T9SS type A sorting domain-containing protein [Bacteroidota bacterium]